MATVKHTFWFVAFALVLGCEGGNRQRRVVDLAAADGVACAVVYSEEADAGMAGEDGGSEDAGMDGVDAAMSADAGTDGMDAGMQASDAGMGSPDAGPASSGTSGILYCWGQGQSTARPATEFRLEVEQVSLGVPSCAMAGGRVYCWGEGSRGELGDGARSDRAIASAVTSLGASVLVETARFGADEDEEDDGGGFACAVAESRELHCWGANNRGQLGNMGTTDQFTPQRVSAPVGFGSEALSDVNAVALGRDFACAVASTSVFCWGRGDRYQLGTTDEMRAQPGDVLGELASLRVAPVIAAGEAHACVLDIQGQIFCWGADDAGQLGQGTQTERRLPARVTGLPMDFLTQELAAGAAHTCARGFDRRLFCWGANEAGQLGSGAGSVSARPVLVAQGVDRVALGDGFTCFESQGAVRCLGNGEAGQLGNGTTASSRFPVPVAGL